MAFLKKIPLAFYILLCYTFLSGYFAFERILNTDNSYYFFNLINTRNFWFAEHRMGIFLSQAPLLLAMHLGFSLSSLIYIYSLSFPVLYIAIALLCQYYFKVKEAALAMAMMLITGIAFSFFHPVTETYHSLAFAILLYAVLVSDRLKPHLVLYYGAVVAVSILSLVSHPIGVFVIGFIALFSLLSKQVKIVPFIVILLLGGGSVVLRLLLVNPASYDVQQYDSLFANTSALTNWSEVYPVTYLKTRLNNVYQSSGLLIIVLAAMALYTRRYAILAASLVCATGFAIIGMLTFLKGDADMMMEKTFMPSIFMLLFPFCYLAVTEVRFSKVSLHIIILFMAFLSFKQIVHASKIATQRLHVLASVAAHAPHPKLIAEIDDFNDLSLHFNHWNTPVDSYIISMCKAGKPFTLFLTADKHSFSYDSTDTGLFLGPPWAPYWNKKMVNEHYFKLPQVGYRLYK